MRRARLSSWIASLALAERAVTAWELAGRSDRSAAAQLVFQQTEPHLRGLEPRRLFPRQWGWPAYAVGAAVAFLVRAPVVRLRSGRFPSRRLTAAQSLAQQLREFARDFQEKAKTEGLRQSLQVGQELEKLAQKNLADKANDEQLKKDLAGVKQKLDATGKSGPAKPVDRRRRK